MCSDELSPSPKRRVAHLGNHHVVMSTLIDVHLKHLVSVPSFHNLIKRMVSMRNTRTHPHGLTNLS